MLHVMVDYDLDAHCDMFNVAGAPCANRVPRGASTCWHHEGHRPCGLTLPDGSTCRAALRPGWWELDPDTNEQHPHVLLHTRAYMRTLIDSRNRNREDHEDPEYIVDGDPKCGAILENGQRAGQICGRGSAKRNGRCKFHDEDYKLTRKADMLRVLGKEADARGEKPDTLVRRARREIISLMEDTSRAQNGIAALERASRGAIDVTDFRAIQNPYEELYKLAGQTLAWKDALAARVAYLDELGYQGVTGEQIKAEVQLFAQALTECRMNLTSIAKLDIEDRMVKLAESQAIFIAEILGRVLRGLGLDDALQERAKRECAEHLRTVGRPALSA